MNKELDRAAMNHNAVKVSSNPPKPGTVVFYLDEKEKFQIRITNAGVGYSPAELETFGEMIEVLREEGRVGNIGSIPIVNLLKM